MLDSSINNNENSLVNSYKEKIDELNNLISEYKKKVQKLWKTNEAVYREKKKSDEMIEVLLDELGSLESEKSKYKEKTNKLWAQSVAIHKEKERIDQLKSQLEHRNKEITDSINYAERIQRSFLASKELLDENLNLKGTPSDSPQVNISSSDPSYFVFFQPKDVVSGDFYWASKLNNGNFAMVNADSTGHGVPGAIMSILNISSLEKAIEVETEPHKIFNKTRELIIERLKKDGSPEGGKDGMDASIVIFDFAANKISFAAANNPVWLVRNNEVIQFSPDKMPVGKHDKDQEPFTLGEHDIQKGDVIYTLTDGFQDQFGGEKGKKFMVKKLREFILSISHMPMAEQKEKLSEEFVNWKGGNEQVDDVCIIGVRI